MKEKQYQAMGWFLTWPHCPITKEDALALLKETGPIKEYVICEEDHKDGTPHLHAYIKYKKKTTWSETKWDLLTYHGQYEGAKSWIAVCIYITKKSNYIANIDV